MKLVVAFNYEEIVKFAKFHYASHYQMLRAATRISAAYNHACRSSGMTPLCALVTTAADAMGNQEISMSVKPVGNDWKIPSGKFQSVNASFPTWFFWESRFQWEPRLIFECGRATEIAGFLLSIFIQN